MCWSVLADMGKTYLHFFFSPITQLPSFLMPHWFIGYQKQYPARSYATSQPPLNFLLVEELKETRCCFPAIFYNANILDVNVSIFSRPQFSFPKANFKPLRQNSDNVNMKMFYFFKWPLFFLHIVNLYYLQ